MSKRAIQLFILCILIIIIAGIGWVATQHHRQSTPITLPKAVNIDGSNQPSIGNAKSPIQAVIFEDLKCIGCKQYNLTLYPKIKKKYIDTGKIHYTVMTLAFLPGSMNAAITARCLYQQSNQHFFDFVAYNYQHQGAENGNWTNTANMLQFASMIKGVDINKLSACLMNNNFEKIINANQKQAERVMENHTILTPSLYVNGILVRPLTLKNFSAIYNKLKG